jgi:hypothetical protein
VRFSSVAAAALSAVAPGAITASFSPNTPRTGATLSVTVDGAKLDQTGAKTPASFRLDSPAGLVLDTKAVAKRCTSPGSCPAASRIGGGTAVVTVSIFGDIKVRLTAFLAPARQAGDLAGIVIEGEAAGQKLAMAGRALRAADGHGPTLLFEDVSGRQSLPAGFSARLKTMALTTGAHRVVRVRSKKTKRVRRVHHHLLTTPRRCAGAWSATGTLTYTDGTNTALTTAVPCRR